MPHPCWTFGLRGNQCSHRVLSYLRETGAALLNLVESGKLSLTSQEGKTYAILAWPLLPDNLVVQPDGKQWVEAFGMNGGRWSLLPGVP